MRASSFSSALFPLLLASIASLASATTFNLFPDPTLSCPVAGGNATWSSAELQTLALIGISGTPIETSAANIASGRCSAIKLPYFGADLGKGAGTLYFVYDTDTDTYEFCSASTADLNGDGYPDSCA